MDPHPELSPSDYDAIRAKAAAFVLQLPPAEGEANSEPAKVLRIESFPLESWPFESESIDTCLKALSAGTIKEKRQAASALALRDPSEAKSVLPLLTGLLDDPEVRIPALRALAVLGPEAAPAIEELRKLLRHEDAFVRTGATYVLVCIGRDAAELLVQATNDKDGSIADLAREGLIQVLCDYSNELKNANSAP